jgi:hypothetical protein
VLRADEPLVEASIEMAGKLTPLRGRALRAVSPSGAGVMKAG